MNEGQFKAFVIPADQGYTTPGSQLYGKALYFEVSIVVIYNVGSTNLTTTNSVVKVQYSLYTDCQVTNSTTTSTNSTVTTTSTVTLTTSLAQNTTSTTTTTTTNKTTVVASTVAESSKIISTAPGGLVGIAIISLVFISLKKRKN